jgi:hypothetical protein
MTANTQILLKRSDVPGSIPQTANLAFGELALNYADNLLFAKKSDGTVEPLTIPPADNEIYVEIHGNDEWDGLAQSRPKRTIRAALNAAVPNTCIKIGAGTFLEDNPLVMPQFCTIYGSGTRGTNIIPINKDKNIIYVNNACYLTGFAFRDYYSPTIAVSYPDDIEVGTARSATSNTIRLSANSVTSNVLANCYREMSITITAGTGSGQSRNIVSHNVATQNLIIDTAWSTSPDTSSQYKVYIPVAYTPQPRAKRYSTYITASPYLYNLSSVTTTGTGFVVDGYLSAGLKSMVSAQFTQFNQGGDGFVVKNLGYAQLVSIYGICCNDAFRAETGGTASMGNCNVNFGNRALVALGVSPLMLTANIAPAFVYNQDKCYRDTGLIVDALAQDLLFDGNTQSTFAGIQYWNQNTYVGIIESQLQATTNTISYIQTLASKVVINDTSGTRYQNAVSQVTGTIATAAESETIYNDFQVILDIINNGTTGVTDLIEPNRITANTDANNGRAYTLLQANKVYLQSEAIAYANTINLSYDTAKCYRDVGYIVDSVSFDLKYGGNRQAVQSGVYYYGYSSNTAIVNEIPQTIFAYDYIKYLASQIITGQTVSLPYQTVADQNTSVSVGTATEVARVNTNIVLITNIISNGPNVAPTAAPIGLTANTNTNVANAAAALYANRAFIQQEVVAITNAYFPAQVGYTIAVRDVVANTDPKTALVANTKPYVGLVLNIDGDVDANGDKVYRTVLASRTDDTLGLTSVEFEESLVSTFAANTTVNFYQRSALSASGQTFEYVGAGTNVATALPRFGFGVIKKENQVVVSDGGAVYYTATDQFGNFQIGSDLVINFNTGTLSGRTFTRSLFAQITPYILALQN